eukprot:gene17618-36165_t
MCLLPGLFPAIAAVFTGLCVLTVIQPAADTDRGLPMKLLIARVSLILSLLLPVYFMGAALGVKFGLWSWQVGLMKLIVQFGLPLIGLTLLLGLVALVWTLVRKPRTGWAMALVGLLIPVLALGYLGSVRSKSADIPPIHDISTDIADPPAFSPKVMAARQATDANPVNAMTAPMGSLKAYQGPAFAKIAGKTELEVRAARRAAGVRPAYKRIDTCAAEFASPTPYMYSTYETECEAAPSAAKKIIILGGGPNRIGQGIEFDYCCCHAAFACEELGIESIMVNCNPETVSTDYDTSDRLYFEPLTLEDVLEIVDKEKPHGVIVQYGGQTPLKLALGLEAAGVPIIGTSPDMIDAAEDRERFQQLLHTLGLRQPPNATARAEPEALEKAAALGYPLVVRPSYVLGGRAMEIVHEQRDLERYMREAVKVSHDSP